MKDRELREVFVKAKNGDEAAVNRIISLFEPLVYKNSLIDGRFDEDIFQELNIKLYKCIKSFEFTPMDNLDKCLDEVLNSMRCIGE